MIRLWAYELLTATIIALGRLREWLGPRGVLRFDQTLPWCDEGTMRILRDRRLLPLQKVLTLECCDCGLRHFMAAGHSGAPVRPRHYRYRLRFGWVSNLKQVKGAGGEVEDLFKRGIYESYWYDPDKSVSEGRGE